MEGKDSSTKNEPDAVEGGSLSDSHRLREQVVSSMLLEVEEVEEGKDPSRYSRRVREQLSSTLQTSEKEEEEEEEGRGDVTLSNDSLRLREQAVSALSCPQPEGDVSKNTDLEKPSVCLGDSSSQRLRERVVSACGLLPEKEEANEHLCSALERFNEVREEGEEEEEEKDQSIGESLRLRESVVSALVRLDNNEEEEEEEEEGSDGLRKGKGNHNNNNRSGPRTSPPVTTLTRQPSQPGALAITSTGSQRLSFNRNMRSWSSRRLIAEDIAELEASRGSTGTPTDLESLHQQRIRDEEAPDQEPPSLAEARPVDDTEDNRPVSEHLLVEEARPVVDLEDPAGRQEAKRLGKNTKIVAFGLVVVVVACLVLIVSLEFGLSSKSNPDIAAAGNESGILTGYEPPPTANLELLWDFLPETTRESLHNRNSPQYEAWDWLLNHPNITNLEEWRKTQMFALVTVFLSLEGPNWSDKAPNRDRFMDVNTSECSWIMTDFELKFFTQHSIHTLGPAYGLEDIRACNEKGEIQTFGAHQIFLPPGVKPFIPPQIGLLTSLRILAIFTGEFGDTLSNFLVPELIQLPKLEMINVRSLGMSGSIPTEIAQMTGLRHLLIGDNELTGSVPTEVANMVAMEHLDFGDLKSVTGTLPSELGLMTRLSGLEIYRSSYVGQIPSQLGLLSDMRVFGFDGNFLSGSLPSELGLMSSVEKLDLSSSHLTGSIPSELGLLTNSVRLRLGNDLTLQGYNNFFSGSLPEEVFKLSNMEELFLSNLPNLWGSIPKENILLTMPNLTMLSLSGSPKLRGTVAHQVCSIRNLDFDCSDMLCGCDCQCH